MLPKTTATLFRRPSVNGLLNYAINSNKTPLSKKSPNGTSDVTKESLQWRTPWDQKQGEWYSNLKAFSSDHNNTDVIKFLQSTINLSPAAIKSWWQRKKLEKEICLQHYIPDRNRILGDDLAAAHFIVFRGGAVKFVGENDWVKQNEDLEYDLPNKFVPNKIVQAIDCSNMNLHYEGLANLQGLSKLEWLSLNNCQYMDDWCMDRISGMLENLNYLDIRNCKNISYRGIGAFYRLTKLETLYVDDITELKSLELTCLMLQELLPKLEIKT